MVPVAAHIPSDNPRRMTPQKRTEHWGPCISMYLRYRAVSDSQQTDNSGVRHTEPQRPRKGSDGSSKASDGSRRGIAWSLWGQSSANQPQNTPCPSRPPGREMGQANEVGSAVFEECWYLSAGDEGGGGCGGGGCKEKEDVGRLTLLNTATPQEKHNSKRRSGNER